MNHAAVWKAFEKSSEWLQNWPAEPAGGLLGEVWETIWGRRGKRLRPRLVYWFGEWCGLAPSELAPYAQAAETLHTASLLHDDVVDRAVSRRGGESANRLYGDGLPILSGDYFFSHAIEIVAELGDPVALRLLCRTVKELSMGECLQYEQRYRIPENEAYFEELIRCKTTSLLAWCALVGPNRRPVLRPERVLEFMRLFGLVFQLSDDLLDLTGTAGKGRWTDLKEGKINYATWLILQEEPSLRQAVAQELAARTFSSKLELRFNRAVEGGGFARVKASLLCLVEDAKMVGRSFSSREAQEVLSGLVELCLDRTA